MDIMDIKILLIIYLIPFVCYTCFIILIHIYNVIYTYLLTNKLNHLNKLKNINIVDYNFYKRIYTEMKYSNRKGTLRNRDPLKSYVNDTELNNMNTKLLKLEKECSILDKSIKYIEKKINAM